MKKTCAILALAVGMFAAAPSASGIGEDPNLKFVLAVNPPPRAAMTAGRPAALRGGVSELKTAFLALMRFYQVVISSQDMGSCQFTLSCSNFSLAAIRTYGVGAGVLMTSDRLQRCHSLARPLYRQNPETGQLFDLPLESYSPRGRKR